MAQLVRTIMKRSSFKDKLPLICFNCGKIGHFIAKRSFREKVMMRKNKKKGLQRKIFEIEKCLL